MTAVPAAQAISWLAWAAALGTAPRMALVVGNSRYRELPVLKNPANDATALSQRLREMAFGVQVHIDSNKATLAGAIDRYCASLKANRGVGLFYFAGHGLQLNWRNYLVPVEARLVRAEDVPERAIDLKLLLDGLAAAGNPMNIVILDACRDNPFAIDLRTGKGLSQMDAPVGTLLAYATAPGNTAADGEGDNGLYTHFLLKEMQAPDSKIEDVFKRVRLGVRLASAGRQIPWESTSLEDDFYFVRKAAVAATREEEDRRYAEELAEWKRIEAKTALAVRSAGGKP